MLKGEEGSEEGMEGEEEQTVRDFCTNLVIYSLKIMPAPRDVISCVSCCFLQLIKKWQLTQNYMLQGARNRSENFCAFGEKTKSHRNLLTAPAALE